MAVKEAFGAGAVLIVTQNQALLEVEPPKVVSAWYPRDPMTVSIREKVATPLASVVAVQNGGA